MAIPTFDAFIAPLLQVLIRDPDGLSAREAQEAVADLARLSQAERLELLPSGAQAVFRNRIGWAHDRLKRAGYSHSLRRGFWQLTAEGRTFATTFGAGLPEEERVRLAFPPEDSRVRRTAGAGGDAPDWEPLLPQSSGSTMASAGPSAMTAGGLASPDDRLEQALAELNEAAARELLELVRGVDPSFFETIVLDLLHRMGYGTSRADLQRVGGSGDGGIDGVISLDRLGFEKVYVQAKRWQQSVGRPEVQAFYGALAGQRARKGVFLTTSTFTAQAQAFAASVESVVLVDGPRLVALMIAHEVGISHRTIHIPRVDADYFNGDGR
jgi:restriction system protein